MRYVLICFLSTLGFFATASDDKLIEGANKGYGSIWRGETSCLTESKSTHFTGQAQAPLTLLPEEILRLITEMLDVQDQLKLVTTSRFFYEGLYNLDRNIMYSSEVISSLLIRYLSQDLSFSDIIPVPLCKVAFLLKRAKTNKEVLDLFKDQIREFRQNIEEKQYGPTLLINGSGQDLEYILQFDEDLSKDSISQTKGLFHRLIISFCRDRRFMVSVGLVSLGTLAILGYFITKSPIETRAYTDFMRQKQISPLYGYESGYLPDCFQKCSLQAAGDGFYVNPPQCDNFPDRGCPCYGYGNTTCYGTYDPTCPDGGCWGIVSGNVSQWLDYFSSQCNFIRHSGYWVNYIQEIINGTRSGNDNSTVFHCVPSENNQSIVCGKSYSIKDSQWDSCDQSLNNICMHLYVGSAQCAAENARYWHLVNYFVPTSIFMVLAVVSTLWYWYFY